MAEPSSSAFGSRAFEERSASPARSEAPSLDGLDDETAAPTAFDGDAVAERLDIDEETVAGLLERPDATRHTRREPRTPAERGGE